MREPKEITELRKTPAAKRSIFLTLIGIPMILVAALGKDNIVCAFLALIYVFALLINGIISFPIIVKMICKDNKAK